MSKFQNTTFAAKTGAAANVETAQFEGHLNVSADTGQANAFAAKFVANLASNVANVGVAAGVYAKLSVQGAGSAVANSAAAIHGVFDYSGGANVPANTIFGLILDRAGDAANSATAPTAYIAFGDVKFNANSIANPVAFLFDIGRNGAYVAANSGLLTTNKANLTNLAGSLKIRVNGATRYIPISASDDGA